VAISGSVTMSAIGWPSTTGAGAYLALVHNSTACSRAACSSTSASRARTVTTAIRSRRFVGTVSQSKIRPIDARAGAPGSSSSSLTRWSRARSVGVSASR